LSVARPATQLTPAALAALDTAAEFQALFTSEIANLGGTPATGAFVRFSNIRSFPAMGTPPNIVKVPVYGQKMSRQIQGQADAPNMEITVNYVGADWANDGTSLLGSMVGDGKQYVFRFTLLNSTPTVNATAALTWASIAGGLGTTENSQYYWYGKIEAIMVTPQLTDANTATLALTVQSNFYGAYTI
jgi:hypothetical protein